MAHGRSSSPNSREKRIEKGRMEMRGFMRARGLRENEKGPESDDEARVRANVGFLSGGFDSQSKRRRLGSPERACEAHGFTTVEGGARRWGESLFTRTSERCYYVKGKVDTVYCGVDGEQGQHVRFCWRDKYSNAQYSCAVGIWCTVEPHTWCSLGIGHHEHF